MSVFNAQDLANTAWAFATVNLLDEKLFRALAREAERRVSEFNAQNLANTAWAFATVKLLDEKLLRALALEEDRRVQCPKPSPAASVGAFALERAFTLVSQPLLGRSRQGCD